MPTFVLKENELMSTDLKLNKPEPIALGERTERFNRGTSVKLALELLAAGKPVLITDFYNNGLSLLHELDMHLDRNFPNKSLEEQSEYQSEYDKLSNLILIEVKDHKLAVSNAPNIGWFEKLYPESGDFSLPFPQVEELHNAWQDFLNGISIPVLRNKVHPYYGTYFPRHFEHIVLFDNWLKRYTGPKKSAIEVGFGSGILSLQMVQNGFQKVFGTDTNPNAFVGLKEFMGETKLSRKIELDFGHLFGKWEKPTELIVFNPPWLPESYDLERVNEAIYYNENLFPEFFSEAKGRLLPEGKLVLIFSNLAQITNATKEHPIEKEIAEGGRFQLEKLLKKTVKSSSEKTKQNENGRSEEIELWILVSK
jgi:SAM-dependent methyltransferase